MKLHSSQNGSAHVVIIIILVIALIGSLGFVFWQNFISKPAETTQTTSTETTDAAAINDKKAEAPKTLDVVLNTKEVAVDISDAKYDDIVAQIDSPNGSYKIYSKSLLAKVNKSNGVSETDTNGCNATVGVFTYLPEEAASVNETYKAGEINGTSVYVGFMGPCDPSPDASISAEMRAFNTYLFEKFSAALK